MNGQVISDLDGRVIDTGTPIGESRHDSVAFVDSGSPNVGPITSPRGVGAAVQQALEVEQHATLLA